MPGEKPNRLHAGPRDTERARRRELSRVLSSVIDAQVEGNFRAAERRLAARLEQTVLTLVDEAVAIEVARVLGLVYRALALGAGEQVALALAALAARQAQVRHVVTAIEDAATARPPDA
jgi:hypothetical protein